MRRALTRTATPFAVVLVCAGLFGCGDEEPSKPSTTQGRARDAAVAKCTGNECRVRVTCKGRVFVRRGAAPVRIRTTKSALVTTIIVDFAGPRDALIRC